MALAAATGGSSVVRAATAAAKVAWVRWAGATDAQTASKLLEINRFSLLEPLWLESEGVGRACSHSEQRTCHSASLAYPSAHGYRNLVEHHLADPMASETPLYSIFSVARFDCAKPC